MKVDLHIHTIYSDGLLTPEQVVKKAFELDLKAISITDHDTIDGISSAMNEVEKCPGLEVIPSIELSTDWGGDEIHILGYYLNYKDLDLRTRLSNFQQKRRIRVERIISKLQNMGIDVSIKDVKSRGSSLGRPHVASALIRKGYATSVQEAFDKYLNKGKPAYVPKKKLTPLNAINMIKQNKGIPVLAHQDCSKPKCNLELIDYGIMGIEVIHKDHNQAQTAYYTKLAKDNNLLLTGGSDCHGKAPLLLGSFNIPLKYVDKLKEIKEAHEYK